MPEILSSGVAVEMGAGLFVLRVLILKGTLNINSECYCTDDAGSKMLKKEFNSNRFQAVASIFHFRQGLISLYKMCIEFNSVISRHQNRSRPL